MTQTSPPPARTRSSRRIYLPSALLLIVVIAWSGFWWYASTRIEREWDRFVVKQVQFGRQIQCDSRGVAGYPFRLEMSCVNPKVDMVRGGRAFSARLADINAVAQVYQPNKVLLAAKGPLTLIDKEGDGTTLTANWASAEASMSLWTSGPENADMVITGLDSSLSRGTQTDLLLSGANIEAHIRLAQGANAAPGSYDLAADVSANSVPPLDAMVGGTLPVSAQFRGTITKVDPVPMPMTDRLRQWADDGGSLIIDSAQANRGATTVRAAGTLTLDPTGHPTGDLTIALAGANELAAMLKQSGRVSGTVTSLMGFGLAALGKPTNLDGKPAVELPLSLRDGRARIGAFPVGKVPSLFKSAE